MEGICTASAREEESGPIINRGRGLEGIEDDEDDEEEAAAAAAAVVACVTSLMTTTPTAPSDCMCRIFSMNVHPPRLTITIRPWYMESDRVADSPAVEG